MDRPRVVVVEDDETLAEFFSMVLELLPVSPCLCRSAEEALDELRKAPADVLVTDLLLPGLDGRGLLKAIRQDASLRGAARLVVMSGSVDDAVRRELTQLGVWRVLGKPVTVKAFRACIDEALAARLTAPAAPVAPVAPVAPDERLNPAEQAIIESHFGGQTALFLAYRQGSLQQFPRDIEQGNRAVDTGDVAGLRRVAHNLKSVLRTLARDDLAQTALNLEDAAAHWLESPASGMPPGARPDALPEALRQGWASLRDGLCAADNDGPAHA